MANSAVKLETEWAEAGEDESFNELHEAIAAGKTEVFKAENPGLSYEASEASDTSDEEDEEEPSETEPGQRLLWAAQRGKMELVKEIVETAANPREVVRHADEDGYTALHRASYSNHAEVVNFLLLSAGADLSARTADGWTPLHSAARWNAYACVEILLAQGADVNAVSEGGQTPLHLAAFHGKARETLQLLFSTPELRSAGKNAQGDTPKDIAVRQGKCCLGYFEGDLLSEAVTRPDEET